MVTFRPYEPDQPLLLPPSLREWLAPDHLVWFICETVDELDLSEILERYRDSGQGNIAYHPARMLKILIYAYANGVFSSRRIARQIEENIALRVLAAGNMPDHRTICRFREQHLEGFERLFVQVVQIARDAGLVKMGTLAVDGSKLRANASKHKAMSYERMQQEERRLRKEIRGLTNRAAKRDAAVDVEFGPDFRGDQLPQELQRREDRLAKIRAAKHRLEARKRDEAKASERHRNDDSRRDCPRNQPQRQPKPKDQENFTDPESRIMKDGSGAFQQCYNAQTAVDAEKRIIVETQKAHRRATLRMAEAWTGVPAVGCSGSLEGRRGVQPRLPGVESAPDGNHDRMGVATPAAPRGASRPSAGHWRPMPLIALTSTTLF